jgi:hypothetical protein
LFIGSYLDFGLFLREIPPPRLVYLAAERIASIQNTLSPDAPLLWRELAVLDASDREQALVALDSVLQNPTDSVEQRMAHYYLGVLAAQAEDWDKARLA